MSDGNIKYGPLVSALGAATLAVSVFMPWYGVSLTASGIASARQALAAVAQQYGNSAFQSTASTVGASFASLSGRQLTTLDAHQATETVSVILLILAGVGLLAALLHLAGAFRPGRGQLALLGIVASVCVLFRILARPTPLEGALSLSLGWGIWLALLGSVAMVVGDLWPAATRTAQPDQAQLARALDGLSGWTP